jgi:parallel beta-helix repeat protein
VDSGTYFENVDVNKQLILKGIDTGEGKPIVNANGSGNAILISAGNSTLEDFMAMNTIHPYAGIYVNSNNNIIRNNTVSNGSPGIFLLYSNNNTLNGNNASNNWGESGIVLSYSNKNTLTGNIASNNNDGIDFVFSNSSTLSNNIISKNQYGIYLIYACNNIVYNNYFNNTNNLFFNVEDYHYPTITYSNAWNISKTLSTNIINGSYLGGNFWANPSGTGLSQTCTDADRNGICDLPYTLDSNNTDYLPLAYSTTPTPTPTPTPTTTPTSTPTPTPTPTPSITGVTITPTTPSVGDEINITVAINNPGASFNGRVEGNVWLPSGSGKYLGWENGVIPSGNSTVTIMGAAGGAESS